MKTINKLVVNAATVAILVSLTACGSMSARDKSTAVGAGAGAVAGAVLSGGVIGTAVGAAAGGVIGNQIGKD